MEVSIIMPIATPDDNDIICGGSRNAKCHLGNRRFDCIVKRSLHEYQFASKKKRSEIISKIIDEIQESNEHGRFVQKDPTSQYYYIVPDHRVRNRTAQAFRDLLHGNYRSNKTFKRNRLHLKNKRESNRPSQLQTLPCLDYSSEDDTPTLMNNTKANASLFHPEFNETRVSNQDIDGTSELQSGGKMSSHFFLNCNTYTDPVLDTTLNIEDDEYYTLQDEDQIWQELPEDNCHCDLPTASFLCEIFL